MTTKQQRLDELLKARDRLDKHIRAITGPAVEKAAQTVTIQPTTPDKPARKKPALTWVDQTILEAKAIHARLEREKEHHLPNYMSMALLSQQIRKE